MRYASRLGLSRAHSVPVPLHTSISRLSRRVHPRVYRLCLRLRRLPILLRRRLRIRPALRSLTYLSTRRLLKRILHRIRIYTRHRRHR